MSIRSLISMTIVLLLAAAGQSCSDKNDKVRGCMDDRATNYNSLAQEDDGSCAYEFQGPRNPSFEDNESAGNWQVIYSEVAEFIFPTGTGFMPTQGIRYADIATVPTNNFYGGNAILYQDTVSFRLSKTMTFDYVINGRGSVAIMFTANGTDTLWHISDTSNYSKKDEVITLPSLPERGRLTIEVNSISGTQSYNTHFLIDNIRVQ